MTLREEYIKHATIQIKMRCLFPLIHPSEQIEFIGLLSLIEGQLMELSKPLSEDELGMAEEELFAIERDFSDKLKAGYDVLVKDQKKLRGYLRKKRVEIEKVQFEINKKKERIVELINAHIKSFSYVDSLKAAESPEFLKGTDFEQSAPIASLEQYKKNVLIERKGFFWSYKEEALIFPRRASGKIIGVFRQDKDLSKKIEENGGGVWISDPGGKLDNVKVIASPMEALAYSAKIPSDKVLFIAIGHDPNKSTMAVLDFELRNLLSRE